MLSWLVIFLAISAAYLYTFPQPNILYAGVVLLHAAGRRARGDSSGSAFCSPAPTGSFSSRAGWLLIAAGAVVGLILIKTGTPRTEWNKLYLHIVISLAGVGLLVAGWLGRRGSSERRQSRSRMAAGAVRAAICLALLAGIGYGARYVRESWQTRNRIQNPTMPPDNMNGEGDGPEGPFFPSSAQVYGKQKIPSKFFMESDSCKRCHEDIYNQWFSSAHHFSSFNNQWYRKSIEYMQDTIGTKPSKWCGGCHDPAVLYSRHDGHAHQADRAPARSAGRTGLHDVPLHCRREEHDGPGGFLSGISQAARTGRHAKSGGARAARFSDQAESGAAPPRLPEALHANADGGVLLLLPQGASRRSGESTTAGSAASTNTTTGRPAAFPDRERGRSTIRPSRSSAPIATCPRKPRRTRATSTASCTRIVFPAANTAVPTANEDAAQLKLTEDFLKSGALTVDIFALSPAQAPLKPGAATQSELATTFAVGEEAESKITG